MHSCDEFVVLLNERLEPVGRQLKATVHHAHTPLHLAFSVFLFDHRGRALFQQRARHKLTWPGVWSNACCGHPLPGESLEVAAHRRLRFELGVQAPIALDLALPDFRYRARWGDIWENELCPVFVGRYAGSFAPNSDEVADLQWIDWAEFSAACRGDDAGAFGEFSPWSRWEAAALAGSPQESLSATPMAV